MLVQKLICARFVMGTRLLEWPALALWRGHWSDQKNVL